MNHHDNPAVCDGRFGSRQTTDFAALILIGFSRTFRSLGELAANPTLSIDQLRTLNQAPVLHSGVGLVFVTTILAVYKGSSRPLVLLLVLHLLSGGPL